MLRAIRRAIPCCAGALTPCVKSVQDLVKAGTHVHRNPYLGNLLSCSGTPHIIFDSITSVQQLFSRVVQQRTSNLLLKRIPHYKYWHWGGAL